jgi:hypothetical protein
MKNLILSGLLLFGGIIISLRTHKIRGTILLLTLLLIISSVVFMNLYNIDLPISKKNIEEYGEQEPPKDTKDYTKDKLTDADLPQGEPQLRAIKTMILGLKSENDDSQAPLLKKEKENTLNPAEKNNLTKLKEKAEIIKANLKVVNKPLESIDGADISDQSCKIILTKPPAPVFKKITGRASSEYIDQIKFEDVNNLVSESGVSTQGTSFAFECPNGSKIVGYDYNNDPKVDNKIIDSASIFGGIGPVYCSDGSRIQKKYGKEKTQTIGRRPVGLGFSTYDYVLPVGFNNTYGSSVTGSIQGVNVDICGKVCSAMGKACNSTSYIGANNDDGNCFFSKNVLDESFKGTDAEPNTTMIAKDARIYAKSK